MCDPRLRYTMIPMTPPDESFFSAMRPSHDREVRISHLQRGLNPSRFIPVPSSSPGVRTGGCEIRSCDDGRSHRRLVYGDTCQEGQAVKVKAIQGRRERVVVLSARTVRSAAQPRLKIINYLTSYPVSAQKLTTENTQITLIC
jgi:hypothetical protein